MINYPYPTEFLGEAVQKNLLITDGTVTVSGDDYTVTGDTITITNSDLEEEAFELHQSINSDMQLRFGSCESAYIAFVIRKSGISSLIGKVLKVYIIPNHNASKMLQLGVFKVQTDKLSYDGTRRSVSAYDAMYDVLNSDVADWYNTELPDDSTTTTVGALAQSFLTHFGLTLSGSINSLPNKDKVIRRTIDPDQLSGADVIKAICEINGVFGRINNEGEFKFFLLTTDIRTAVSTWEIPIANYIDIQFDDYDSKKIDALKIITDAGVVFYSFAPIPQNTYTISGNFLISDYDNHSLNDLASRLKMRYYNHYYTACTVNALGNPVLEPGDPIKVITKNGETYTYILERHMRGIQALRDTYTAHGEEYSSESLNNISNRYSRVNSEVSKAVSQVIVQNTNDFPELIRNIGYRLLDEPSDVAISYDDNTNTIQLNWSDPPDISTNEPVPCEWAGTVVVRKEDFIPIHRWDGTVIVDSNVRDQYKVNPFIDLGVTYQKKYYYGIFPYDTKGDYRFTRVVSLEGQSVNRKVVVIDATGGSISNTIGNIPAIVVEGQSPTYDSVSGSSYFGAYKCLWKYSNGIVTRQELQNCRVIYVDIEAKMTTESIGALANIAFQLRKKDDDGALHKLIQVVAGNGNALSYALPLVRFNNYVDNTVAVCPLYARQNEFHKLSVEINLENLVAKKVVAYLDGEIYADEDLNVTLDAQFDEYMFYFETMDYSYLRNITMRME